MKVILLLSLFVFVSCATSRKIKNETITADEGIIVGKVTVLHKGKDITDDCSLIFKNGTKSDSFKLDKTGVVALKMPKGEIALRKLVCSITAPYTNLVEGATFNHKNNTGRTFFGNVVIDWDVDGGFKGSMLLGGAGAGYEVGKMKSEGKISMQVKPEPVDAVKIYKKENAWDQAKFSTSIIGIGKTDYSEKF